MYSQHSDLLVRTRMAEVARRFERPARGRGSLRIILDSRRARRQAPAAWR